MQDRDLNPPDEIEISEEEHGEALCELIVKALRAPRRFADVEDYVADAFRDLESSELTLTIGEIIADALDGESTLDVDFYNDEEIGRRVREMVLDYVASTFEDKADTLAAERRAARDDDDRWGV